MSAQPGRNDPCPCGSGGKFKACCGQLALAPELSALSALLSTARFKELESRSRALLARYPEAGLVWQLLGASLRAQDQDALQALERAATLLPANAGAHSNLGNALASAGRLDEAIGCYRRALALRADFAEAHHNLGNALLDLGQPVEAAASYRRALAIRPDYAEALGNLGAALRDLGRLDEAIASYRQGLGIRPEDAALHTRLASALRLKGRTRDAEDSCRRALELDPTAAEALVVLAEAHADRGAFTAAEELLGRAISLQPQLPEAWAGIPKLRRMTLEDASWLESAERLAAGQHEPRQELLLRYALGKYHDDVGDFEHAFAQFQRANELTRRYRAPHDRMALTHAVDATIRSYDRDWLARAANTGLASSRPVFIVGMLRSGTTLAEQILAAHPAVFGAGELDFWSRVAGPDRVDGAPSSLAADYLRLLEQLSPLAERVVDKMPANFLHLGLIHAALPNARIVHLQRHPIDTCLSIYFQHFERSHSYANDLEDLAHAYGEYLRLMRHWRQLLPSRILLEVPYEQLVAQPEIWSRHLVEFTGLPWDPRCLEFERLERSVITASKWQVRQKINSSSVGRWQRYEPFIGPLRRLLDADQDS